MSSVRKTVRTVLAVSIAIALAISATQVARADHGSDYARGNVRVLHPTMGVVELDFSAHSNFNGTEPRGRVRLHRIATDAIYDATVVSLGVNGTLGGACILANVTSIRNPDGSAIGGIAVFATDTGKFANAPDLGDVITFPSLFGTGGTICGPGATTPVLEGEIVVHDSTS